MRYPLEETKVLSVISPAADLYNGDPSSDAVDVTNYHEVAFTLHKLQGASTGEATLQVMASAAANKANPVAVPFHYTIDDGEVTESPATGLALGAADEKIIRVQPNLHAVGEVGEFVFLKLTEDVDAAVPGSVTFEGYSKRYSHE